MSDKASNSDRFDKWTESRNRGPGQKSFSDRCEDIADAVLSFCMSVILIIVMTAAVFWAGWTVVCEMKRMVEAS